MAFGNPLPFSGYEPHPDIPGAYSFQPTSGGAPVLAAGDEAERLKGLIDRSPKPMDNATASNGGIANLPPAALGQAQGMNDFIQGQSAQDFRNSLMAGAPQAHAPSAPPGVNPTAVPPAAPPPQAAAQRPVTRNITGGAPAAALVGGEAPPNPGPNPQDYIKHVHTSAGFTPTSQKVVTEGGVQDPEMAKLMGGAYSHQMAAEANMAEAQKLQLTAQVQAGQIATAQAAKEADDLHKKQIANMAAQQEATKEFDRVMAVKQGELADTSKQQVDQFRMYRGKPGAQVGAAIAAGLGAFGSSLNHGPNFALDIINRGIDNDIQAQREEINRGVAAKQNDIVRIRDKYGVDTTMAEKLLNMQLTERAQTLARQQAAVIGTQEAQGKLAGIDSALAAKQAAILKEMQSDLFGKAQVTAEEKYHMGGDADVVDPRLLATAKAAKALGETGQGLGQAAKGAYEATHEGTSSPKAGAGGPGKLSARLGATEAINESAQEDLKVLNKADAGGYIAPSVNIPLAGTRGTDARTQLDTAARALVGKVIAAKGETPSHEAVEKEMERAANPNPAIREAYRKYAQDTLKTVHSAVERQRGGTAVSQSDAAEAAESQ